MNRQEEKVTKQYECQQCGAKFYKLGLLAEHRRIFGHRDCFECSVCKKRFGRKANLDLHLRRHQDTSQHQCHVCGKVFSREDLLGQHVVQSHNQTGGAAKRPLEEETENDQMVKWQKLDRNDNPEDFYNINLVKETNMAKFKTKASCYKITFKDLEIANMQDILKALKRLFQSIIENITRTIDSSDLVRISIDNPELDFPVTLPFMKRSALTLIVYYQKLREFYKLMNSLF